VFDHVTIRASDRAASARFYDLVLPTLEIERTYDGEELPEWDTFSLTQTDPAQPAYPTTERLHVAFVAPSREHVEAFWRAGTEAGFRGDGAPGPRPQYRDDYYGAFLLDPDGNSVEAVHHGALPDDSVVDHLWIRVADVPRSRRFYDLVAPHAGFEAGARGDDRSSFVRRAGGGSFSVVRGEAPTVGLHVAFPVDDDARVVAFHDELTAAGHASNGAPGERPEYHAGYYGAFVWDPDGANVELVNHHR
jgi:catechol 2,3-dioxygenase-like lactoylglutathione lyase family enzyme